jgi:hypothetical protein
MKSFVCLCIYFHTQGDIYIYKRNILGLYSHVEPTPKKIINLSDCERGRTCGRETVCGRRGKGKDEGVNIIEVHYIYV